jgi:SpoVK/Ycf46/Vps4 family AAA+-type ATPase
MASWALRDRYYTWRERSGFLIITTPVRVIPNDLERELAFFSLEMPAPREIRAEVAQRFPNLEDTHAISPETVAATLKGLTLAETRHALARLENQRDFSGSALRLLQEEKRQLIKKTGTLEYIPEVPSLQDLGGLENLKDWLVKRKDLLLSGDEALREIAPKGILLMGVSGCGKSLCIKAISSAWQIPLYRMEMVRIFSGGYGSPEIAFAEACRIMGEMAPAVLWLDEIEMSLSSEGGGDAALSRIFAYFLTWMQEKPAGLFVAATANRIDLLPAEMIRKGRFDQVFFVDLPTKVEREHIYRIHLQKRGYDPEPFTPEIFADATEGWNGAEIEQFVIAAVTSARMEQRELVLKDLYAARKQIVPISTTMEEQVRHIRNWAYERAVRASAEET